MSKRCLDGLKILYKGYKDNKKYIKRAQTKGYLLREKICFDIREGNIQYMMSKNWKRDRKDVCYIYAISRAAVSVNEQLMECFLYINFALFNPIAFVN